MVRAAALSEPGWIVRYSAALDQAVSPGVLSQALFSAIPFLAAVGIGVLPFGSKLLFFLIGMRGCILSYFLSVCYITGISISRYFYCSVFLLPLFYILCQEIWIRSNWFHN